MNEYTSDNTGLAMPPEELFDLLADRATFGLDEAETRRLDTLLREFPWVREDCIDEAAAAVAIGFAEAEADLEEVPDDVMSRISRGVHAEIDADASPAEESPAIAGRIEPPASGGSLGWMGWVVAAAAVALAVMVYRPVETIIPTAPSSEAELVGWIDDHPEAIKWDWSPGLGDGKVEDATGLVTFDPASQEGFMLIKGLEPNDPRFQQYQLWIWDQDREPDPDNPTPLADNVHPVDGGVFDVNDEGEAVIPIKASLVIDRPYLFAVTVERPGGVAKSDKSQVPIIAGPPSDA